MKIPVSHIVTSEFFQRIGDGDEKLLADISFKMHYRCVDQDKKEIKAKVQWLGEHNIDYKILYELDNKEVIRPAGHIVDGNNLWDDFNFYRCYITMYFKFNTEDDATFFKISN